MHTAPSQPPPNEQASPPEREWKGMDGATAWHLIDRHAESWADVGKMMNDWLEANRTPG